MFNKHLCAIYYVSPICSSYSKMCQTSVFPYNAFENWPHTAHSSFPLLFQKIFVMPNMDDVWLSIMHSAMDTRTACGPLVSPTADPEPSQSERDGTSQPWRLFTVFNRAHDVSKWELEPKDQCYCNANTFLRSVWVSHFPLSRLYEFLSNKMES